MLSVYAAHDPNWKAQHKFDVKQRPTSVSNCTGPPPAIAGASWGVGTSRQADCLTTVETGRLCRATCDTNLSCGPSGCPSTTCVDGVWTDIVGACVGEIVHSLVR